jgi:hypothetical protein
MEFAAHLMYSLSVNVMTFSTDPVRHYTSVLHQRNVTPSKLPKLQTTHWLCIVLIFKSRPSCDWGKRPSICPLPKWASIRGRTRRNPVAPCLKTAGSRDIIVMFINQSFAISYIKRRWQMIEKCQIWGVHHAGCRTT